MSGFTLMLQDAEHIEYFKGIVSFVGEDASGSFGILPYHGRFLTLLNFGLARFRPLDGHWRYVALPGGVLVFANNTLVISTRRYFCDTDYRLIGTLLDKTLRQEEADLGEMKESLRRLEEEMLKSLWSLERNQ